MKNLLLSTKALVFCFVFATCHLAFAQTTHTVNNTVGTTADFTSVQAAIDAAAIGDIIYIQQSPTSYGDITINKGLTLVGRSHSETNTNYRTTLGSITIAAGASDTTINGLSFNGLYASNSSGTINNLIIKENSFRDYDIGATSLNFNNILFQGNFITDGVSKRIGGNATNVLINNNIFLDTTNYTGSDLIFQSAASIILNNNIFRTRLGFGTADLTITNNSSETLTISNSIFIGTVSGHNINLNSGIFEINNCLTYNDATTMSFGGSGSRSINNTIENADPLFTNDGGLYDNTLGINKSVADFTLLPGSLAIGAGTDGGDIGVLGGYAFSMFGQPRNTPYLEIESFSSTVPKNTPLTVTIKAKSN